ncbi:MAG: hypothetical protein J0M04_21600 [Verrucomicrobia bacterium]|nr:hypothetical protein [Verrucomicrobiota bacterium]
MTGDRSPPAPRPEESHRHVAKEIGDRGWSMDDEPARAVAGCVSPQSVAGASRAGISTTPRLKIRRQAVKIAKGMEDRGWWIDDLWEKCAFEFRDPKTGIVCPSGFVGGTRPYVRNGKVHLRALYFGGKANKKSTPDPG